MKKAKIMLSAIAVLAVVSGTVAFKAHRTNVHIWTSNTQDQCLRQTSITTTDAQIGNTVFYTLAGPSAGVTTTCSLTAFTSVVE